MSRVLLIVAPFSQDAAEAGLHTHLLGCADELGLDSLPDDLLVQVLDGCLGLDAARQLMLARIVDRPEMGSVTDAAVQILVGTAKGAEG